MNNDQLSSTVWFILGLAVCLGSLQYKLGTPASPGTGFMPFLAGLAICFFSGIGLIHSTLRRRQGEGWVPLLRGVLWKNALIILVSLLAYALLLVPLGFSLTTALFIGFLLRAIAPQRWSVVVACSLLTAAISYLLFEVWLKAQLPKGPFGI
ncbi:MAG: tripartite tricarboxylate transporter TctB family protein [Syntrophaceae bacterium]|nr:tripartite tricarboxylate transporter TctB family protein [Syntrophaceae bacterium]